MASNNHMAINLASTLFGLPEARDSEGRLIVGITLTQAADLLVGQTITVKIAPGNCRSSALFQRDPWTQKQHELINKLRDLLVGLENCTDLGFIAHRVITGLYRHNMSISPYWRFRVSTKHIEIIPNDEFGEFLLGMVKRWTKAL